MSFVPFNSINFTNKKVMVREDFNVPIDGEKISDNSRIKAALPTLQHLIKNNAHVGILSHLGRPKGADNQYSLAIVAKELSNLLEFPVKLANNDFKDSLSSEHITLFENVRFLEGETENDEKLAKSMANLCDIFVMDAFATSHRSHASTCGIAKYAKQAIAGPLLVREIATIKNVTDNPAKPVVAIVAGAKISSKLPLLTKLIKNVDKLIIGGGMANTCLKALEHKIGNSLYEQSMLASAKTLIETNIDKILLPKDVVVAKNLNEDSATITKDLSIIESDDVIADIGQATIDMYTRAIEEASTIIWNGPLGIFEMQPFMQGTKAIANSIANSDSYSLAGGGDTIAAINKFEIAEKISYISTGGGAFLALLQQQELPGVIHLAKQASTTKKNKNNSNPGASN